MGDLVKDLCALLEKIEKEGENIEIKKGVLEKGVEFAKDEMKKRKEEAKRKEKEVTKQRDEVEKDKPRVRKKVNEVEKKKEEEDMKDKVLDRQKEKLEKRKKLDILEEVGKLRLEKKRKVRVEE